MRKVPLGALLEKLIDHRGKTPKKLGTDFTLTGVPVASAQLVTGGILDLTDARCVDEETWRRWMPVSLKKDDVLLTSEAPLGRVAWVENNDPLVLGQRLFALRVARDVADSRYLGYWMSSAEGQSSLRAQATGSTVSGIRQSALLRVEVPAVHVDTQRAIGEVLGSLDERIVASRRLGSTLDALIAAMSARIKSKSSVQVQLGDILRLNYGRALPVASRCGGNVAVVGSGGIVGFHNESIAPGPSVVVGRKGSVGSTYWLDNPSYPIDTTYWVEPTGVPLIYAFTVLKGIDFSGMSTDSAVPGLNRDRAYAIPASLPSREDLNAFERSAEPLLTRAAAARKENQRLAATRDELLPLLMSGKITIKDAEKTVEEVV